MNAKLGTPETLDAVQPPRARLHPVRDGVLAGGTVAVVTVLSTIVLYFAARQAYVREVYEELLRRATVAASFVDGDLHQTFFSPDQEDSHEYRRAVAPLRKIMDSDPSIRFLYTAILVEGDAHFILDATPHGDADGDGVEDHSPIMERYEDPDQEMLTALREGRPMVMHQPKADKWGALLSAYAPLHDTTGGPVGIAGVDVSAQTFNQRLRTMQVAAWAALVPAFALSILVGVAVSYSQGRRLRHTLEEEAAQSARRDALARFKNLVENAPVIAIQGFDRQGIVSQWNRQSCALYGYSHTEAIGCRIQDLILAIEEVTAFETSLGEIWSSGQPTEPKEWPVHTSDGRLRWVYSSMFPILSKGVVDEVFRVDVDITDRKQHEQDIGTYAKALDAARTAAEAASCAKSEFLANMSHEIRTPMTAILGYTELLTDSIQDDEQLAAVATIHRNGTHLLSLINDILDISRVEAGKLQLRLVNCSLRDLLSEVVDLMRVRANDKTLRLTWQFDGPCPATIRTDLTRLRQILVNLVGNAIKFTETGEVRLTARIVDRAEKPPQLQCDIIDTGIGLSADQCAGLFQAFHQAEGGMNRKFGGSGLGLYISRHLARLLGGDIIVTSELGRGSCFSVTINIESLVGSEADQSPDPVMLVERMKPGRQSSSVLTGRILLAEDGPDNQRLIAHILRKAGAEVIVVADGRQAVAAVEVTLPLEGDAPALGGVFDLVLMDMQMPIMDGYEATRELRRLGYTGMIAALTAHAMTEDRDRCLAAGCNAYLTKPIDRRVLIDSVAAWMPNAVDRPTKYA